MTGTLRDGQDHHDVGYDLDHPYSTPLRNLKPILPDGIAARNC
jgi:hypothetical protein